MDAENKGSFDVFVRRYNRAGTVGLEAAVRDRRAPTSGSTSPPTARGSPSSATPTAISAVTQGRARHVRPPLPPLTASTPAAKMELSGVAERLTDERGKCPRRSLVGTVDRQLVILAREGDHDAFARLAAASIGRLNGIARLILHDYGLAEDAVQESLVEAWRNLRGLRDPDRFDPWLNRILVRACQDARRRESRRGRGELPWLGYDEPVSDDTQASIAASDQLERGLRLSDDRAADGPRPGLLPRPVDGRRGRDPWGPDRDNEVAPQSLARRLARGARRGRAPARTNRGAADMTAQRDLDRLLRDHFESHADRAVLDGQLDAIVDRTATLRQRPGWLAGLRSNTMSATDAIARPTMPGTAWVLVALGLLVVLAVAALVFGGARLTKPAPFNGMIAFARQDAAQERHLSYVINPDGTHDRRLRPETPRRTSGLPTEPRSDSATAPSTPTAADTEVPLARDTERALLGLVAGRRLVPRRGVGRDRSESRSGLYLVSALTAPNPRQMTHRRDLPACSHATAR